MITLPLRKRLPVGQGLRELTSQLKACRAGLITAQYMICYFVFDSAYSYTRREDKTIYYTRSKN